MFKRSVGWVVGCSLLWLGCSEPEGQSETDEIISNLLQAGFPRSDIQVVDETVYVGRDAAVSLAASREMVATPAGSHEQYRTTNLVSSSVRTICVNGSAFNGVYSTALDAALANYNNEALSFLMVRTAGGTAGCDAFITANSSFGMTTFSAFPSGGLPFPNIYIGDQIYTHGAGVLEHVITHELGHTVGLRHTDYFDPSISCVTGSNEGPGTVGANHVPGTPTGAIVGGSVMNACYRTSGETGNFSAADITALRNLYPWRPATGWSSHYSDGNGWSTPESNWGTIAFPDINGDGKGDVCGRNINGLNCAISNGFSFVSPFVFTAFTNAHGWAAFKYYWGTLRYPDLNGDGKADVCGRSDAGPLCALSTGTSFAAASVWVNSYRDQDGWNGNEAYWGTIEYPDVNGDGRDDICGRGANGIFCALSTGSSFSSFALWSPGYSNLNWAASETNWRTISYPDLNGDGRDDVCGRAPTGIYCALSNGSSFGTPSYWTSSYLDAGAWNTAKHYWGTIRYPDLNADGKADICGRAGAGLLCALSSGTSFGNVSYWLLNFRDIDGWSSSEVYWNTITYADIDGDNRDDVCGRFVQGIFCARSTGASFANATFESNSFSDYDGWQGSPSHWTTLRMPDVDGNGHADVCGRSVWGIVCTKF